MPTTSLVTTFAVLTTLNNAGQLAPPDKAELPPGTVGTIFWDEQTCMLARGRADHPEKYFCQVFTSPKTTQWTYVAPGSAPMPATPADRGQIAPEISPGGARDSGIGNSNHSSADPTDKPPEIQAPKPKRVADAARAVAQRPRHDQQAMFAGNPLNGLFNW